MSAAHHRQRAEPGSERQTRLISEAELIAAGKAEAGVLMPTAKVSAWIDSLGTDNELPMPQPSKRR